MKRLLLAIVRILKGLIVPTATVDEIKRSCETFWNTNRGKFTSVQNTWKPGHRNYWQGIATPTTIPDNGALVVADYTKHPTDQAEAWATMFTGPNALPASVPCQMTVDVYDGPAGFGWTHTATFTKDNVRYWRTWNIGAEPWRDHDWMARTGGPNP